MSNSSSPVVKGKVHRIFETKQVTEKLRKREFVLKDESNPMYPQFIKFECSNERCDAIDDFKEGDTIEVGYNLRGREYTNKATNEVGYFNSIEAWRFVKVDGGTKPQGSLPGEYDNEDPFA